MFLMCSSALASLNNDKELTGTDSAKLLPPIFLLAQDLELSF
jgi:hypothetical protein